MKNFYLMITVLVFSKIAAQDLPSEMYYSPDGKTLHRRPGARRHVRPNRCTQRVPQFCTSQLLGLAHEQLRHRNRNPGRNDSRRCFVSQCGRAFSRQHVVYDDRQLAEEIVRDRHRIHHRGPKRDGRRAFARGVEDFRQRRIGDAFGCFAPCGRSGDFRRTASRYGLREDSKRNG